MMQNSGWNTPENLKPFSAAVEEDVIRLINSALIGNSKHTTSYKFAFFKSILDNIFNVDLNSTPECFLSFDSISLRFSEIYWNLVVREKLRQMPKNQDGKISAIEKTLYAFIEKYGYSTTETAFAFEGLSSEQQLELSQNIKKNVVTNYVLGAFCCDTNWEFYHYSKPKKWNGIYLNGNFFTVLTKYRSDFEKVNYFEWIKYLEDINQEEDSYCLANKLDRSTQRENLNPYRKVLFDFGQTTCFYCNKRLAKNAVDHFIPWSFVKDDKLWNFVLACPSCNSKKSDKLTTQNFLNALKARNEKLSNMEDNLVQSQFKAYAHSKLQLLYNNALYNGYTYGWEPKHP